MTEALSTSGEPFGFERLAAALAQGPSSPEGAVASLLEVLGRFTHGNDPSDDVTLVALGRTEEL